MTEPPRLRPSRVRGVVFDLDGTLVDSYAAIAASLNHARACQGLAPLDLDRIRAHVGRGLEALVADLVDPRRVEQAVRDFRTRYAEVFERDTAALPGADATLDRLHAAGYVMTVASNKPARFGRRIVEALGWSGYFRAVLGPDVAGATKPDPSMIRLCLEAMGTAPHEALYVGDMALDVESAARAEIPVVLVCGGSGTTRDLAATGQTVLAGLGRLPDLLGSGLRTPARPVPG